MMILIDFIENKINLLWLIHKSSSFMLSLILIKSYALKPYQNWFDQKKPTHIQNNLDHFGFIRRPLTGTSVHHIQAYVTIKLWRESK